MFLMGKTKARTFATGMASDPNWAQAGNGRFHRFLRLDPEAEGLSGVGGVYVIWHAGVHPDWVYVGRSADLAASFHYLVHNKDIMRHEVHGGLYVSWALIREEYQEGVVKYLTDTLRPSAENPEFRRADVMPVPVIAPGIGIGPR